MGATRIVFFGLLVGCAVEAEEPPPSTLFVTDYRTSSIVRFDGATGALIDVFASGAEQRVDRPASVQRGPDGLIYSAGFGRGDVVRYDPTTGAMMDVFYWDTRLLEEPMELVFHGEQLLVLGNDTKNVVVLDHTGYPVRELGYPVMRGAQDFVVGDGDQLFVATESHPELGSAIQVWDLATGTLARHFGSYAELAFAAGLALHDGVLYVCDWERGRILRFDPATGASLGVLVDPATSEHPLVLPVELAIGPDGALYVLDASGLHRFDRETGAYLDRLVPVDGTILVRPQGFTFVSE